MPRKYKNLDSKDRKLLCLLSKNARIPVSKLSKSLGISRELADYRIRKLQKLGYIKSFNLGISNLHFGYEPYYITIKLQNITNENIARVCNYLKHNPNVKYLERTSGNWDISMSVAVKNKIELARFVDSLNEMFGDFIAENHIFSSITTIKHESLEFIERVDYSDKNSSKTNDIKNEKIVLDKRDKEILRVLSENSRLSVSQLARKLKMNPYTCQRRFNTLQKIGIIRYTKANIAIEKFGLEQYIILLKINKLSREKRKKIFAFLKEEKKVMYAERILGNFDMRVTIVAQNQREFDEELNALRSYLREDIKQYSFSIIMETLKKTSYPEAMW